MRKAEFIYLFIFRLRKRMRTGGVSGGPIRQALTPGPFLMARWLTNRKGLAYPPILCPDLAALVFTAAASGPLLKHENEFYRVNKRDLFEAP
jgi:hypothetical protein